MDPETAVFALALNLVRPPRLAPGAGVSRSRAGWPIQRPEAIAQRLPGLRGHLDAGQHPTPVLAG
jgi:hypothetical protein